jgi:hypothetical protein
MSVIFNKLLNLFFCKRLLLFIMFFNSHGSILLSGLFLFTKLYSTGRLTNAQRDSFIVTSNLHEVIIGCCLGDLNINRRHDKARLRFEQGSVHEAYIMHLYDLFKYYCSSAPKNSQRKPDSRTGKVYSRVTFITYSLPCFNYYHDLFYEDKVKRIPLNIGELLTPAGLAYWAMDDGCKKENCFYLCTESYTLSEVELLIRVLKQNFDLNCSYHIRGKDSYRIYIKSDSMDKFRSLVTPHFHESMRYKLTVSTD